MDGYVRFLVTLALWAFPPTAFLMTVRAFLRWRRKPRSR